MPFPKRSRDSALGDLSGDAAIVADITYLVRPQLNAVIEAFRHVSKSPASVVVARIAEALARLIALKNQLRRAQLLPPGTPLVTEVREAMHDGARHLDRLRWALVGSDARERQRQARSSAAFVNRLEDIDRRVVDEFARVKGDEKGK